MIYENFEKRIVELLKIRSTNYRMTSNDLYELMQLAYTDIFSTVVLDTFSQVVEVDATVDTYDLDALLTATVDGYLTETLSIKTEDGHKVKGFRNLGHNVWKYDKFVFSENKIGYLDRRNVVFERILIPDIKTLDIKMYNLILPIIVEGILFFTQDALPNPTSSNSPAGETNIHSQRYFAKIQQLRNTLPQVR